MKKSVYFYEILLFTTSFRIGGLECDKVWTWQRQSIPQWRSKKYYLYYHRPELETDLNIYKTKPPSQKQNAQLKHIKRPRITGALLTNILHRLETYRG